MNGSALSDPSASHPGTTALVLGGGVAGIAAAVRLAERGVAVTLVETRKRLGGRATSFTDPASGELVDNCQHVLMRCCTNLIDLYRRLGVIDRIRWEKTLYFADDRGRIDVIEADDLPAPLHLTRALLGMRTLSIAERLAVARGMLAILQIGQHGRRYLSDISFEQWLREQDQPRGAIDRFWSLIVVSACNETLDRVAARYAVQVFQEGFLAHEDSYQMGVANVPLAELYDPAERTIARAGGRLMLSTSVEAIEFENDRVVGARIAGGEVLRADAVIAALPFDRLAKVVSEPMLAADVRLRVLGELRVSPILGIHLHLRRGDGRPVTELPHVVLLDSPIHWLFNKGPGAAGRPGWNGSPRGTTYLHGVISAAHDLVDESADAIIDMAVREVRRFLPGARDAEVVHARVIKEKRATFSCRPGVDRVRPSTTGGIENLFLAGDWVDTGWPATMEGAARSGYKAAAAVLRLLGHDTEQPGTVPDARPTLLYRFMAG